MRRCLIGYTGFVGGNLDNQLVFDKRYNSKNIHQIRGQSFDEVYCAGVSAVKWWANRHPEEDWLGITVLLENIAEIRAERFILISTVDVYRDPWGVDEETKIITDGLHYYGLHRRKIEQFIEANFLKVHIIRLPGLFGTGLKKNIIYDLMHNNDLKNIHGKSIFQFYNLDNLSRDLALIVKEDLRYVNFATEPISVSEIAAYAFGIRLVNDPVSDPARYDMRTLYGRLFGRESAYLVSKQEVLEQIRNFVLRSKGSIR